jgi:hypothetical protein
MKRLASRLTWWHTLPHKSYACGSSGGQRLIVRDYVRLPEATRAGRSPRVGTNVDYAPVALLDVRRAVEQ